MNRFDTRVTHAVLFVAGLALAGCGREANGSAPTAASRTAPAAVVALEFPPFDSAVTTLPTSAVIIAGKKGVTCFSHDGEKQWDFVLPEGEEIVAPATAAPNSVTFVRSTGSVHAISENGEKLWSARVEPAEVPAIVALGDSTVVITTGSGSLVNLDGDRGMQRWTFQLPDGDRITAAPRVANNSWIYVRGNARLYAVNSEGVPEWDAAF